MGLMMRVRFVRRRLKARTAALAVTLASVLGMAHGAPELPAQGEDAVTFFRAAQLDDAGRIKPILARGLSPNVHEPERGETAMIVALRYDAMKVFKLLLSQPNIQLEEKADNGNTALMMAAFKGNKPAVLALLDKGAQVNRPGWTALHYAAAAGDTEIMRILLEHHAYIDAESPTGVTPLMIAAREGKEEAVQLLLAEGADATLKDRGFKSTAAEFAERADKPWISTAIRKHLEAKR